MVYKNIYCELFIKIIEFLLVYQLHLDYNVSEILLFDIVKQIGLPIIACNNYKECLP